MRRPYRGTKIRSILIAVVATLAMDTISLGHDSQSTPASQSTSSSNARSTAVVGGKGRLVGRWDAGNGYLVFTFDDGATIYGVVEDTSGGYHHTFRGRYLDSDDIEYALLRVDPNNCQTATSGRIHFIDADNASTSQQGWNGCGVKTSTVTGHLKRVSSSVSSAPSNRPSPTATVSDFVAEGGLLVGQWSADGRPWSGRMDGCPMIFASDNGKAVEGGCNNGQYNHVFHGHYSAPDTVDFTVTRIDPKNCRLTVAAAMKIIDRNTVEYRQQGWNGCGVSQSPGWTAKVRMTKVSASAAQTQPQNILHPTMMDQLNLALAMVPEIQKEVDAEHDKQWAAHRAYCARTRNDPKTGLPRPLATQDQMSQMTAQQKVAEINSYFNCTIAPQSQEEQDRFDHEPDPAQQSEEYGERQRKDYCHSNQLHTGVCSN